MTLGVRVGRRLFDDGASLTDMFGHEHDVALAANGVLAKTFSRDRLRVNSVHYQGVDRLGAGLAVEATAHDGVATLRTTGPTSTVGPWRTGYASSAKCWRR